MPSEREVVTIWTVYVWTCECGADNQLPMGLDAPNRGDELTCEMCSEASEAGETR